MMNPFTSQCGVMFADYLSETRTLRKLTINNAHVCFGVDNFLRGSSDDWVAILQQVTFRTERDRLRPQRQRRRYPRAQLLCQNRNLRRFKLVFPSLRDDRGYVCNRRVDPWLLVVAENETLEELTLNVSWNADDCRSLFETLASNASLKITVTTVRDEDCAEIYGALRETGVQERFTVCTHDISRAQCICSNGLQGAVPHQRRCRRQRRRAGHLAAPTAVV
ncbi:hypothetical protein MTO96_022675 [Rhipicephalus appendiculatus]